MNATTLPGVSIYNEKYYKTIHTPDDVSSVSGDCYGARPTGTTKMSKAPVVGLANLFRPSLIQRLAIQCRGGRKDDSKLGLMSIETKIRIFNPGLHPVRVEIMKFRAREALIAQPDAVSDFYLEPSAAVYSVPAEDTVTSHWWSGATDFVSSSTSPSVPECKTTGQIALDPNF